MGQDVGTARDISKHVIPSIIKLAEDRQWRVRIAIVECVPLLAQTLGPKEFDSTLTKAVMGWLVDHVFAVREATMVVLRTLIDTFDRAWFKKSVVPKLVAVGANRTYLQRLTALMVFGGLAVACGPDIVARDLLPLVLKLGDDPVPNIRFNVAKALSNMAPLLEAGLVSAKIVPVLRKLAGDSDVDVQFFA